MAAQPAVAQQEEALQPALLEVIVNGQRPQEVLALRGQDRSIYVELETLQGWRLGSRIPEPIQVGGKPYIDLSKVAGLSFQVDEERQSLSVELDPARMAVAILPNRPADLGPMTASGWGAFANYDLLAELSAGNLVVNGAVEMVAFAPIGTVTSTFLGRLSNSGADATRLETNWTVDDPGRMRSLRIGDSISRGGIGGGPVRFGGVQLSRNFAVEPGFVTLPLPSISGSAALPSVVDVYVNNVLQQRREVQPGPFHILDVPIVTGGGEVQLIVQDLLGRQTVVRESYYATSQLLRPGLHDYSYEVGFLRRRFGQESADYGAMFAAGTHRLGLSSRLTGEVHVEASGDAQTGGVAATWLLPSLGIFNLGAAISRSDRGEGALLEFSFERRTRGLSLGFGATFATDEFTSIGSGPGDTRPSSIIHAFAGIPVGFGSVGLSYVRRDERLAPTVELLSATTSMRVGSFGSLHLSARQSFGTHNESAVSLLLAMPLGSRSHASATVDVRDGDTLTSAALHRSLPIGEGVGYRLSATQGRLGRVEGGLDINLAFVQLGVELTWTEASSGARMVASGSLGLVDGHAFAARTLGQSFALVRAGGYPNVRVYADNQLVGRTNRDGVAIVPRLRPYERNVVHFETEDVPLDAEIEASQQSVRPYRRSGVAVTFPVHSARGAIVSVKTEEGAPLPAGSILRLEGRTQEFVSGPQGEVYLSGLAATTLVQAEHPGGSCHFRVSLPATSDPQPRIEGIICSAGRGEGEN